MSDRAGAPIRLNIPMKTITLSKLDNPQGTITPIILEALNDGATADNDPSDPHNKIIITFKTDAARKAFAKALAALAGDVPDPDVSADDAEDE